MKTIHLLTTAIAGLMLISCAGGSKPLDERTMHTVDLACDETFRPIIGQELRAFQAKYTDAILDTTFLPETDALNLLLKDSVTMAIATRPFTEKEKKFILDKYRLVAQCQPFAYDAIALIVNPQNPDTLLSVNELRKIVTGKLTRWSDIQHATTKGNIEVVFDDENSSTVRYIRDSICGGAALKGNLKTAHSSRNVIDYVRHSRNAIGIIGVDWIRNIKDSTNLTFDQSVRVMSLSNSAVTEPDNCFQPVQYYIATADYPLIRQLYILSTNPYTDTYNHNFYFYLTDTEGQLIITKSSQLLPLVPVQVKQVDVND